jgi:FkbM family methyltransferase
VVKELVGAAFRAIRVLRRIKSLELREDLKAKIRHSYLGTILLRKYDSQNNIASVAGYRVKFRRYESLAYLFNEIFLDQEYFFLTDKKDPFIVDCGSNIGMSILYFKMIYPRAVILAFEPDTDAFLCLEANVRLNDLQFVDIHMKALSKNEGPVDFYFDPENRGCLSMSIVHERMPKQRRLVEAVRLSRYIDREVDFLKMDVEGAEGEIIKELSSEGKLRYIAQMAIEFHHHTVKNADALSQVLRLLENAGFGYQIESSLERPFRSERFQDILIYAYRKA